MTTETDIAKANSAIREAIQAVARLGAPGALVVDWVVVFHSQQVDNQGRDWSGVMAIPAHNQPEHRTLGLLEAGLIGYRHKRFGA